MGLLLEYLSLIAKNNDLSLTEAINDTVEKKTQLTEFSLQEGETQSTVFDYPHPNDRNPYSDSTPTRIMEREYEVYTGTITAPSAGVVTNHVNFLDTEITASTTLTGKVLLGYQFMRWKTIEWRLLFNASPYIYGMLYATCLPYGLNRDSPDVDWGFLSHDDTVLVDISSMTEVKISQPWNFPMEWYDLSSNLAGGSSFPFISLTFGHLNTVYQQDSDSPTAVPVNVYARLTGVELAGFRKIDDTFEAQAGTNILGAAALAAAGIGVNSAIEGGINLLVGKATEAVTGSARAVQTAETTDKNSADVVPNVFGGMVFSPQKNLLGDGHQSLPYNAPEHSVMDFLKKPSLINITTVTSDSLGFKAVSNFGDPFSTAAPLAACSRIVFMGQFFRKWRGSINYTFVFFSSSFNSWRIYLNQSYGPTHTIKVGDTATKMVTVRGTNKATITVPWLYPFTWDDCNATNTLTGANNVQRYVTNTPLYITSVSGQLPAKLLIMVYEAAGDDFQFSSQREPGSNVLPSGMTHQAQMRVSDFCKYEEFADSGVNIEHIAPSPLTFETMAKRWSGRSAGNFTSTIPVWFTTPTNSNIGTFDAISCLFAYYRGMQRFKFFIPIPEPFEFGEGVMLIATLENNKDVLLPGLGMPGVQRAADGLAAVSLSLTQVLEYTVPYISNYDWQPIHGSIPVGGEFGQVQVLILMFVPAGGGDPITVEIEGVYVSGGSDFVYSYIMPPPPSTARWYSTPPFAQSDINSTRAKLMPNSKGQVIAVTSSKVINDTVLKSVAAVKRGTCNKNRSNTARVSETTSTTEMVVREVL